MRIICPNCASQYEVDARLFGPEGREVQCAQCDTQWTQYPEEERPAAAPSRALPDTERDAIRRAAEEEVAIRDTPAPAPVADEEDDLIRSLREQLSQVDDEPEDEMPDVRRPTGRRNLAVAADIAGVDVSDEDEDEIDDRGRGRPKSRAKTRAKTSSGSRDLAAALEEYERERRPRRGGRSGFITALVLAAVAAGAYIGRDQIVAQVPEAAPALETYAQSVDQARLLAERLYSEGQVFVASTLEQLQGDETSVE